MLSELTKVTIASIEAFMLFNLLKRMDQQGCALFLTGLLRYPLILTKLY